MQTQRSNPEGAAQKDVRSWIRIMVRSVADRYRYNPQSRQLIEEMAELTQAINKFWRKNMKCGELPPEQVLLSGETFDNIVEEIADVEILLEQIKYLLGIEEQDIISRKMEKLERQAVRIGGSMVDGS